MSRAYADFLATKALVVGAAGIVVDPASLHTAMFDHQRYPTAWALRKGRAALFLSTGLGKTLCYQEWARRIADRALVLAPLAVCHQAVAEAQRFGLELTYARQPEDAPTRGTTITNYEMVERFDPRDFPAVVLDESSCLKDWTSQTTNRLTELFADTPYRLCCTATPAPNDIAEIANHAEFLGVMSRVEMLAAFFVHDDEGWRLRRHAREPFYRWLASWGMAMLHPRDLGFAADGYDLPPLTVEPVVVRTDYVPEGQLFPTGLHGIGDRSRVRKGTLEARVGRAADLIRAEPDEPWIAWCGLNDESTALARLIPGAIVVEGSQSPDEKAVRLARFATEGGVLVTKASIAGHGLNYQHCARQVFVGLDDSWERYYQAIRRSWRFGQTRPVDVYVVLADLEEPILANVLAKEREAMAMTEGLIRHVARFEREEIDAVSDQRDPYDPRHPMTGPYVARPCRVLEQAHGEEWDLYNADSAEALPALLSESIDLSVYSPPFASLYVYSPSERDLGNSADRGQFWEHFGFVIRENLRLTKPGRLAAVHVANIAKTLGTHGVIGVEDFRGDTIRAYEAAGWIFHGEVAIQKNPQAAAIRTHAKGLLFAQLGKDASWMRPTLLDYILLFRKPGENAVPVKPDITNEDWIAWAHGIWLGIKESDTLNVAEGRDADDERHICALQLGAIERCIRLWSNPGDLVLTPFLGIGSEAYQAIKLGRRAVGVELKPRYFQTAVKNVRRAEASLARRDLFSFAQESAG